MRFVDFLRNAVLLFGASASVLAAVAIAGARARDDRVLLYVALAWWVLAALAGLWIGRRREASAGTARLLRGARGATSLPELEPGAVLFNRLWALALFTVVAGGVAFLIPQVPAIGAGYALCIALAWRKQSAAVEAIEGRDGVQFHVERTSPFKPTQLVRTAGFRKIEPVGGHGREPV
jgi:4-amino-4-deoxy-L-arabinose transferase-like glycosyltransferase